jgi:hypothetical protein
MLEDLHVFLSRDPGQVSLQGKKNRITVNVRIDSTAIDDLPGIAVTPSQIQRVDFARFNLEAFLEIAETLLERGEAQPVDCDGRPGLEVRIRDVDLAEYLHKPGATFSFAALRR